MNVDPAWIAGGAAIVSSVAAIWSARNGNRTLKRSDRDSQSRTRPMVAAELREEPYAEAVQLLVIKNYGQSVARNVSVTFSPPLGRLKPGQETESGESFLERRYSKTIPTLVPGVEMDNVYFYKSPNSTEWKNVHPFPDQVRVTIEFDAPDGEHYTEHFDLDVNFIRDRTFVTSSRHPDERLKQAVKALENAQKALASIARSMPKNPEESTGGPIAPHDH